MDGAAAAAAAAAAGAAAAAALPWMTFGVAVARVGAGEAAAGVRFEEPGVDFEDAVREGVGVRRGCGTRDVDAEAGVLGVRVAAEARSRLGVRLTGLVAVEGVDFAAAVGVERERNGEAGFFTAGEATFEVDSLFATGDGLAAAAGFVAADGADFAAAGLVVPVPTGRDVDPVLVVERTDDVLNREEEAAVVEVVLEPGTREREVDRTGAGLAAAATGFDAAGFDAAALAAAGFDAVDAWVGLSRRLLTAALLVEPLRTGSAPLVESAPGGRRVGVGRLGGSLLSARTGGLRASATRFARSSRAASRSASSCFFFASSAFLASSTFWRRSWIGSALAAEVAPDAERAGAAGRLAAPAAGFVPVRAGAAPAGRLAPAGALVRAAPPLEAAGFTAAGAFVTLSVGLAGSELAGVC